jgi:two-component system phosphate regulon sensor histidine kinase PhoR
MNRKRFIILIVMMLFSLVGIIWVQIIWISNDIRIRNENFDYFAYSSIQDAAGELETMRKMSFFNDFMVPGINSFNDTTPGISGYLSMGSYSAVSDGNFSVRITNQTVTQSPGQEPVIVTHDTIFSTDSTGMIMSSPDDLGKMIIINSGDSLLNNEGGVYVEQKQFLDWVRRRGEEFRNMSDQMITEVYQWEKTMNLDVKEIEYVLRRSLMYSNIQTPFEFAVIKNGEVTDGMFRKSNRNDFLKSKYMVKLFPDNIIRQDLILSVVFPERTNYVLGKMAGILGGSLLFSLIILATFALSLFFIIRQKKISEMKSDFINNMTHEFKTPIATISLAADTITNPKIIKDESSIRHFINMIKKENSRMDKKVETILQIASLDKQEIQFRFGNLSIHSLIEKAVDTIDIIVKQRNGRITLNLKATEPVIQGDSEHLFNLVNNLLDNAIKYSKNAPDIRVETRNERNGVILCVSDKGIGMSRSVQGRIFERFYRQASGNVHDVKGFGLGLNYVRAIVDAHKGDISVQSEPGKGSNFEVFLPFNPENENEHKSG